MSAVLLRVTSRAQQAEKDSSFKKRQSEREDLTSLDEKSLCYFFDLHSIWQPLAFVNDFSTFAVSLWGKCRGELNQQQEHIVLLLSLEFK